MNHRQVTISGKVFEIVGTLERISVADSFVVPDNKTGGGNGEAKLYVGQNTSEITDFFGERGFEIECVLSKHNLLSYLDNAFSEYNEPSQEYRKKSEFPDIWNSRNQEINGKRSIIQFKIKDQNQLEGQRVYINAGHEDSDKESYFLLRELPLPMISYIDIYKIKDSVALSTFYYFTLHLLEKESSISEEDIQNPDIEDKFVPGPEDGVDVEKEISNEIVTIQTPFDPNKIKVRTTPSSMGQVIDDLNDNFINLNTEFQRLPNLWNATKKSRFIESLLLKLPIPAFYFNEKEENNLEVIDGLQRISTIKSFVILQNFALSNLEFLKEYNDKFFSELPSTLQRRVKTFPITTYIIEKGTPIEVKYNIFKRVNTGGLQLTDQEIRHAINQGPPAELIADLARGKDEIEENGNIRERNNHNGGKIKLKATREGREFVKATDYRIGSFRMEDRDFITRFVSFYLIDYNTYEPNLDTFLNNGMAAVRDLSEAQIENLKNNFYNSMKLSYEIFGNDAFRKRFFTFDDRKPINKALFEVLSVSFAKLSDTDRAMLKINGYVFKNKFIQLHHDPVFLRAISQGTAIKDNVLKRFREIEKIINESIAND